MAGAAETLSTSFAAKHANTRPIILLIGVEHVPFNDGRFQTLSAKKALCQTLCALLHLSGSPLIVL